MYLTWKNDNPYFEKKKCKMIFIIFCAYLPPTLNTIYKLCRILEYRRLRPQKYAYIMKQQKDNNYILK